MGFYSPQSLVADARRHGVVTRGVDIVFSDVLAGLELDDEHAAVPFSERSAHSGGAPGQVQGEEARGGPAIRLGLASVRGISVSLAERIVDERSMHGPFASVPDLTRRTGLTVRQVEALATAGALDSLAGSRRAALWAAGAAVSERPGTFAGLGVGVQAPTLPGMSEAELMAADTWATGVSAGQHPMQLLRGELSLSEVLSIAASKDCEHGERVWTSGVITHRQRPKTATGITFLSLEDETGILNVVCSKGFWRTHRALLRTAPAVRLRGIVEKNSDGVVSFVADAVRYQVLGATSTSRNFQ